MTTFDIVFYLIWVACGVEGALTQRRWYKRKGIKHRMAGIDFAFNGVMGPIALVGCWIAYGGD